MTTLAPEKRLATRGPTVVSLLFRPFDYIAGTQSLLIGIVSILTAGFLGSLSRTHFDGVLDMHTGLAARRALFLAAGIINWLSLSVVLFLMGKLVSRTAFRAVDLFGTQALARWPTVIAALAALAPPFQRLVARLNVQLSSAVPAGGFSVATGDLVFGGLVGLAAALCLVWMVWLMYHSYTVCCNIRGGKALGTFIAGLIIAEVISKVVLSRFLSA
jgi:hypothetical protein